MPPRPLTVAATAVAGLLLVGSLLAPSAQAAEDDGSPVVVDDTIRLYPGQSGLFDVLANDTSPIGDDLALCRFPAFDPSDLVSASELPSELPLSPGEVYVSASYRARGAHVIDYYVCDHSRLVPARLTVVVRDVAPVDVAVAARPGRVRVTNHNDQPITFLFGHPRGFRADGRVQVAAGAAEVVRVQRHRIAWVALIRGRATRGVQLDGPGVADHGSVGGIELRGEPLPQPPVAVPVHGRPLPRWARPS